MGDVGFDPRYDDRVKEQQRLNDLTATVEQRPSQSIPELYLPDYEGYGYVSSMSDRTAAGGNLVDINGVPLKRPIDLRGGQDYMFENPGQVWASAEDPVRAVMMQAAAAKALTGKDPLYLPWRMAPSGGDFAHMTGETMLSFAESNMGKGDKRSLNAQIKKFIPDWKGIDSPESIDQYRTLPDADRKALKNFMDKNFRERGGLSIGEARLSVSDPSQLTAPEGYLMNVGRIFADKPMIEASGHPSYPKGIPGEGIGRLSDDRSLFELNPKVFPPEKDIRRLLADPSTARSAYEDLPDVVTARGMPDPREPRQSDTRALQMKPYYGIITEELLKSMGYAEGGLITDTQTPVVEAIKDTVRDPQAARMLDMDLARLAVMNQPQRMAGGGVARKGAKALVNAVESAPTSRIDMNFKDVTKRTPELQAAAQRVASGEMSAAEYDALVNQVKPVTPYDFVPTPATREEAMAALTSNKQPKLGAANQWEAGTPVGLRLDIPAYSNHGVWVNSIHGPDSTAYGNVSSVTDATFGKFEDKALRVAQGEAKSPFAKIEGKWNPVSEEDAVLRANQYLKDSEWRQIGMDPERHGYFYDRETMQPVTSSEEVLQIGPLVLAKNPVYANKEDFKFADGGVVRMAEGGTPERTPYDQMIHDQALARFKAYSQTKENPNDVPVPSLDDQRLELMNSPVIEATPQSPTQKAIGTLGGYMGQAGEFVTDTMKPIEESHPIRNFMVDMLLADPLKNAGAALQDYTKTSREYTEDRPYRGNVFQGSGQTLSFDPRVLDIMQFAQPAASAARKVAGAGAKAVAPFAKDAAAMANELYMTGQIPGAVNPTHPATAWHGTPHEIKGNKFDNEKINTGEGAQAYGHGHYVAEARSVGEEYAKNLANRDINNQNRLNAHANAQRLVDLAGDPQYAADDIKFVLGNEPDHHQKQLLSDTLKMIESGEYNKPLENAGNLYKLDVADEIIPKMLDWDKPISEQHPDIQAASKEAVMRSENRVLDMATQARDALIKMSESPKLADWAKKDLIDLAKTVDRVPTIGGLDHVYKEVGNIADNLGDLVGHDVYAPFAKIAPTIKDLVFNNVKGINTGRDLYTILKNTENGQENASKYLQSLGITGIRYLDQGSRSAKKGSRNMVVFDPEHVKFLERNDVPIERKNGGKVQFANNIDAMRNELKKAK